MSLTEIEKILTEVAEGKREMNEETIEALHKEGCGVKIIDSPADLISTMEEIGGDVGIEVIETFEVRTKGEKDEDKEEEAEKPQPPKRRGCMVQNPCREDFMRAVPMPELPMVKLGKAFHEALEGKKSKEWCATLAGLILEGDKASVDAFFNSAKIGCEMRAFLAGMVFMTKRC